MLLSQFTGGLCEYGFKWMQNIINRFDGIEGVQFYSTTHKKKKTKQGDCHFLVCQFAYADDLKGSDIINS